MTPPPDQNWDSYAQLETLKGDILKCFDINRIMFVCLLQDASGHSNVLKAGKAEELKNARKRRAARKANYLRGRPQGYEDSSG